MPRYFFHLRSDAGLEQDDFGVDFDSLDHAYLDAHAAVFSIAADLSKRGEAHPSYAFEITDADGRLLIDLPFLEALTGRAVSPIPGHRMLLRAARDQTARMKRLKEQIQDEYQKLMVNLEMTRTLLDKRP